MGLEIGELEFGYGEEGCLEGFPFLLAVDFHPGVVSPVLSFAKQVRYVCSFSPFLSVFDLHTESVEVRGGKAR